MALAPLLVTVPVSVAPVPVTPVAALVVTIGGPLGVTLFDADDGGPDPRAFVAVTVKV